MWQRVHTVGASFGLGQDGRPAAQTGRFDTDLVPLRQRFDYYRETTRANRFRTTPERGDVETRERFRVRARNGQVGDVMFAHYAASDHRVGRGRPDIADAPMDAYYLLRPAGGRPFDITVNGADVRVSPGDLLMADADRPFEGWVSGERRYSLWIVPKPLVDPWLGAGSAALRGGLLVDPGADGALLRGWLDLLARPTGGLSPEAALEAGAIVGRLSAVAVNAAWRDRPPEPVVDAVRAARAAQVTAEIDRRFAEPLLDADGVAARLRMSVRTLHLALEPTGRSFTRHLEARRLAAARHLLETAPARGVADIAFACGFGDLSTFHRAFKRAYAMTPGECRTRRRLATE